MKSDCKRIVRSARYQSIRALLGLLPHKTKSHAEIGDPGGLRVGGIIPESPFF